MAIVGLLTALGLPAYLGYEKRAAYAEVLAQASPVKQALIACMSTEQLISRCNSLSQIGASNPSPTRAFNTLSINGRDLSIRLVPNDYRGIQSQDTCDLKPTINRQAEITGWSYVATSPCVTEGYVKP